MTDVLIDTDVLLDVFYNRMPFAGDAAAVLSLCEDREIAGYVTPVMLSNLYYLLRKTADHKTVIAQLRKLITVVDVLHVGRPAVEKALQSDFLDFEDALQHFAGIEDGRIQCIITRNVKDFQKSSVSVLTPAQFLAARRSI